MWGAIISGVLGAGSSIYGGIAGAKNYRKLRDHVNEQQKENQSWYDRRYNEDATQRADAQLILNKAQDSIRRRNRAAAGTAAVMGGSQETVAAEKEANNQALADATAQIVAANEKRKDMIEEKYRDNKSTIEDKFYGLSGAKNTQIAQATVGAVNAAGSIVSAFDKENQS